MASRRTRRPERDKRTGLPAVRRRCCCCSHGTCKLVALGLARPLADLLLDQVACDVVRDHLRVPPVSMVSGLLPAEIQSRPE